MWFGIIAGIYVMPKRVWINVSNSRVLVSNHYINFKESYIDPAKPELFVFNSSFDTSGEADTQHLQGNETTFLI